MPSRNRALGPLAALVLLANPFTPAPLFAADSSSKPGQSGPRAPDQSQIARALETVKADPNLAPEATVRTLKWVGESRPQSSDAPASLQWLLEALMWFAKSARILVWVAVALLVGLLAIYLVRLVRSRRPSINSKRAITPTHVQDLDIRPESLPDNIGTAARKLWDSGEHRAALSLLYRGVLSRLVHVHNVPIRDSSTEGDCLRLSANRLQEQQRNYVALLVRVWQHAVYGGQQPETAALYTLCDGFAPALDIA